MTEIDALMVLIRRLPEVDMASLFEQLNDHINDHRWGHLVKKAFSETMEELEEELAEAQDEIERVESTRDDYAATISTCLQLIEESNGTPESILEHIKMHLQNP